MKSNAKLNGGDNMLYQTRFCVGKDCPDLAEALLRSRSIPCGVPRTIELSGMITLKEPILLDERDNGLTLKGGAISGGAELTEWERDPMDARFVRAKLPEGAKPRTLVIGGSMKKMSVYPADSMLECLDKPENLRWMSSVNGGWNRQPTEYEMHHMHVNPDDVPPSFLPGSTEVKLYHNWDESTVPVSAYDKESGEITFASELGHPAGSFGKNIYQFLNLRDGMTEPGMWYADLTNGWIYYYPAAEEGDSFKGVVPVASTLIRISGGENITLSDIELSFCGSERVTSGLRSINFNGAVEVFDSKSITIHNLNIHDCSGNGIKVMNSENNKINCCQIKSMGAGGIFTHNCGDEMICFNNVKDIGLAAFSSIGIHAGGRSMLVWVIDGKPQEHGCTILRGNRIEGVPYCGITCNGGPHIIENNTVIDFMTKLEDGASIYVSRGDRVIVRGNSAFGNYNGDKKKAYYFDEGGRDCLFENNQAFGVKTAYGDHRCERMIVRHNHFECAEALRFSFHICSEYEIYENVIATENGMEMDLLIEDRGSIEEMCKYLDDHIHFRNNIITAPSKIVDVTSFYGEKFEYTIE